MKSLLKLIGGLTSDILKIIYSIFAYGFVLGKAYAWFILPFTNYPIENSALFGIVFCISLATRQSSDFENSKPRLMKIDIEGVTKEAQITFNTSFGTACAWLLITPWGYLLSAYVIHLVIN